MTAAYTIKIIIIIIYHYSDTSSMCTASYWMHICIYLQCIVAYEWNEKLKGTWNIRCYPTITAHLHMCISHPRYGCNINNNVCIYTHTCYMNARMQREWMRDKKNARAEIRRNVKLDWISVNAYAYVITVIWSRFRNILLYCIYMYLYNNIPMKWKQ